MPTLVLQDVPADVYAKLAESASRRQVSPEEEVKRLLRERFGDDRNGAPQTEVPNTAAKPARQPSPIFMTEEIPAPFSLPRPGEGVVVKAVWGGKRRPSPLIVDQEE